MSLETGKTGRTGYTSKHSYGSSVFTLNEVLPHHCPHTGASGHAARNHFQALSWSGSLLPGLWQVTISPESSLSLFPPLLLFHSTVGSTWAPPTSWFWNTCFVLTLVCINWGISPHSLSECWYTYWPLLFCKFSLNIISDLPPVSLVLGFWMWIWVLDIGSLGNFYCLPWSLLGSCFLEECCVCFLHQSEYFSCVSVCPVYQAGAWPSCLWSPVPCLLML